MKRSRTTTARLSQLLAELERTPHLAGLGAAAAYSGWAYARGIERPRVAALTIGTLTWWASRQLADLDRGMRSAEDAAVLAARLGRMAPLFGLFAAEGDFVGLLAREVELGPGCVVECGCGATTLAIGAQLAQNGRGRLISLEHDPAFAGLLRGRLANAKLTDHVSIIDAPLEEQEVRGKRVLWYSRNAVDAAIQVPVDMLVVDGPPQRYDWARWPAVELLYDRFAQDAAIFADDGRTGDMRRSVKAWSSTHPDLERYWIDTVKGTWVLRRCSRNRPRTFQLPLALRRLICPRPGGRGRWAVRR